jgi:hypothetical protein
VKVPRGMKELGFQLNRAREELSQRLGHAPTASEIASQLGIDREEVVQAQIASTAYPTLSSDAPGPGAAGDDDGRSVNNSFGHLDANVDKVLDAETVRPLARRFTNVNEPCSCFDSSRNDPDPDRRTARDLPDARLAPPGWISCRIAGISSDTNTGMSRLV